MDALELGGSEKGSFVRTYLLASIPIVVSSYILGGWLAGIISPLDVEYMQYLEREHGTIFHVKLYRDTKLYLILSGIFIGNIGYIIYSTQFENANLETFYSYVLKYSIVGGLGSIIFFVIGTIHANLQYPLPGVGSYIEPSAIERIHAIITNAYATIGVSVSVLLVSSWKYYERKKAKKEKQKERFDEIKNKYLQARVKRSDDNTPDNISIPTKYGINNTKSVEQREEKLDSFNKLTKDYTSIINLAKQTEEKLDQISEGNKEKLDEIENVITSAYEHISNGNENNLENHKEKLSSASNKLDDLLKKERTIRRLDDDSTYTEISSILADSLKELSLEDSFEEQINLYNQLFDSYMKIDELNYSALSISIEQIKSEMISIASNSEEGYLEKDRANELIKITEGIDEFVSFAEVNDPEYTGINTDDVIDKIVLAIDEVDYDIISEEIESINETRNSIWKLNDLYDFSWEEFEYLISDLWENKGYRTKVGAQTSDKGIDVIATNEYEKVAIQVKQFSQENKVGARVVRNTGGVLPRGFDRVAVVTSSYFTSPAKEEAADYGNKMELLNGEDLILEMNESDLVPPNNRN